MKNSGAIYSLKRLGMTTALFLFASLAVRSGTLTWDATPASGFPTGADGNGNWGTSASSLYWWNGAANGPWNNAVANTAVFGVNTATATTVTMTNGVVAGGITFSNAGTATYTIGVGSTTSIPLAAVTNLTLVGANPTILMAAHNSILDAQATDIIQPSIYATGTVSVVASTATTNGFVRFANITNNFLGGSVLIGTPGNSTYGGTTALFCDFNTPTTTDPYVSILNNATNITVYSNATVRISNHNGGSATLVQWPKQFTLCGDGRNGAAGAWTITGNVGDNFAAGVVLAGDTTIDCNAGTSGKTYGIYGVISGNGHLQFVADNSAGSTAVVVLTNASTWNGGLLVAGGVTLQLSSGDNRLPTTTALTLGRTDGINPFWNRYGSLTLGSPTASVNQTLAGLSSDPSIGTSSVIAGGNSNTNAALTINNNTDYTFAGTLGGALAPANRIALVKNGAGNLFLQGANQCAGGYTVNNGSVQFGNGANDYAFSGPITNNAAVVFNVASAVNNNSVITGNGSLSKQGGGTLALMANSTIGGPVTVAMGTLVLSNNNTFAGPVTVSSGTLTCVTTQAFNGPLNLASSTELDLRRVAATNYTTAASLSLNYNTLKFDFNSHSLTPAAPLQVAGTYTNTGTLAVYINNINPGSVSVGSYPLIKYGSFVDAGSSSFTLAMPINTQIAAYITNNTVNGSIDLVVTAADYLQWTGATDTNWDYSTANWLLHSSLASTVYTDGGTVVFNDSGNNTSVNLAIAPSPSTITVSNVTKSYSFVGSSAIGGAATLTKQGSGTLTMANGYNSYSGLTLISGGTLVLGDGVVDTALAGPIEDDSSLILNIFSYNAPNTITGTGSVTVTNGGTLVLNNPNTYTGATTIVGGTVQMNNSAAFGTADSGTVLTPGTELDIMANVTTSEALTLAGTGVSGGGALVVESGTGASTWNGPLTATANSTLVAANGTSLTLGGGINAGNNLLTLLPASTAYFTVSNALAAGTVLINDAGGIFLMSTNDGLTNVILDKANPTSGSISSTAGINVYNSRGLGTNCSVTISNANLLGNSGAILRLGNNANIPAGVSLNVYVPGDGDAGVGTYRATFGTLGANTTNTWNGPITVHGADPSLGVSSILYLRGDTSSQIILNNNLTLVDGVALLGFRGFSCSGIFNGSINMGTNMFNPIADSGISDIYLNGTSNVWGLLSMAATHVHLGVANALPTNAPVLEGNASGTLDLNGFNQQVMGLYSTAAGSVVNNSTNTASTLTISSAMGSNWMYSGSIANVSGAKPLNLNVSGTDPLTLTGAGNNYAGSTIIGNGATLALNGSGNISASTPIDVQVGGTFDVSTITSGGFTLTTNQTLMGNGIVNGSVSTTAGSKLAPGESVGTLTITTNLNIGGNLLFAVNKALSPAASNSVLVVEGGLTNIGTGTLIVTNLNISAPLALGNRFVLFNQPVVNGGALSISPAPGLGLGWTNNLAVDGSISVIQGAATNPTNITYAIINPATLQLSWPADHLGWHLQSQTNSLSAGVGTNWTTISGSDTTNSATISIDHSQPAVFYRLVYP